MRLRNSSAILTPSVMLLMENVILCVKFTIKSNFRQEFNVKTVTFQIETKKLFFNIDAICDVIDWKCYFVCKLHNES